MLRLLDVLRSSWVVDADVMKGVRHCLQWATAPIDVERRRAVFVLSNPLNQRVLHPWVLQVVNERVPETVECLPGVGDAQLGFIPTEPLRRCVAQLPPHGFELREQAIRSDGSY